MDILVLNLVSGLVVVGGIWMVIRDTKPAGTPSADPDFHVDGGRLNRGSVRSQLAVLVSSDKA